MANLNNGSNAQVNNNNNNNNNKGVNQMSNALKEVISFAEWVAITKAFAVMTESTVEVACSTLPLATAFAPLIGIAIVANKLGKFLVEQDSAFISDPNFVDEFQKQLEKLCLFSLEAPVVEFVVIEEESVDDEGFTVIPMSLKTYGNKKAPQTFNFAFNDTHVKWSKKEYLVNPNLIKVEKVGKEFDCVKSSPVELINLIVARVKKTDNLAKIRNFLNSLVGTVLVSEWQQNKDNVNSYAMANIQQADGNLVDAQAVLLSPSSNVVAFHVDSQGSLLTVAETKEKSAWVEGCLEKANEFFGLTLSDKTNSKRGFCNDAAAVMGVVKKDGNLFTIADADKGGKALNRWAMVKHIAGKAAEGEGSYDLVLTELSNGKFAFHHGVSSRVLLVRGKNSGLLSAAIGDGGALARSPITNISNKRIKSSLNLEEFFALNPEVKAEINAKHFGTQTSWDELNYVKKSLKTHLETTLTSNGGKLAPVGNAGSTVSFGSLTVLENDSNLETTIVEKAITLKAGEALNTDIRTIEIDCFFTTKETSFFNKIRSQWVKATTTRNDNVSILDREGKEVDFDLALNGNTIKNDKFTLIRAWASLTGTVVVYCLDGEFRLAEIDEDENVVLGNVLNWDVVKADLLEAQEILTVSFSLSVETFNDFGGDANFDVPMAGRRVVSKSNGLINISFEVEGINVPNLPVVVELSTAEENAAFGRRLSPIQSKLLGTFAPAQAQASAVVKKAAKRIASTIKIARSNKIDKVFDLRFNPAKPAKVLETFAELQSLLTQSLKNFNARDAFRHLKSNFPNGIQILGTAEGASRPWEVIIPCHVISVLGNFKKDGRSFDEAINETFAFLVALNNNAHPQIIADYAFKIGVALRGWKSDVVKSNKAFTKGAAIFETHGLKVIGNGSLGFSNGLPILALSSKCELVANRGVKDGDVIFVYRNPMVELTPAVVKIFEGEAVVGRFHCAMSPSVLAWSSQTDNDGDVLWMVEGKKVRIGNVDSTELLSCHGGKTNAQVAQELANHPLVGKNIAVETMKAFNCDDLFDGIIKGRPSLKDLETINPLQPLSVNLVGEAAKVASHYLKRVGQGYSAMFNAFHHFCAGVERGKTFTEAELMGIKACSFVLYEEWGLAGFTESNEANFVKIDGMAKEKMGLTRLSSSVRNFKGLKSPAVSKSEAWACACVFVAQRKVQSAVEWQSGKVGSNKALIADALSAGVFRSLTKGAFSAVDDNVSGLFALAPEVVVCDADPFSEALSVWQAFAKEGLNIE